MVCISSHKTRELAEKALAAANKKRHKHEAQCLMCSNAGFADICPNRPPANLIIEHQKETYCTQERFLVIAGNLMPR